MDNNKQLVRLFAINQRNMGVPAEYRSEVLEMQLNREIKSEVMPMPNGLFIFLKNRLVVDVLHKPKGVDKVYSSENTEDDEWTDEEKWFGAFLVSRFEEVKGEELLFGFENKRIVTRHAHAFMSHMIDHMGGDKTTLNINKIQIQDYFGNVIEELLYLNEEPTIP